MEIMEYSKSLLQMENPFLIRGEEWTEKQVIEHFSPQVTEERLEKLKTVVAQRSFQVVSVLESIYDRGNISAVMRSAEAFGYIKMRIIEHADARFKDSNRISKGAEKWMDVKKYPTVKGCVKELKASGYQIFATHLEAGRSIEEVDFSKPTALVFGNEKEGVSDEMLELVDDRVFLPMRGFTQSFNISVAAALAFQRISLWREAHRKKIGKDNELTSSEKQFLLANYLLRNQKSKTGSQGIRE